MKMASRSLALLMAGASFQGAQAGAITFVHITDPQLGMKHYFENCSNITAEVNMFKATVDASKNLNPTPAFAFIGGDMQNYWPDQTEYFGGAKPENGACNDSPHVGITQRKKVHDILAPLQTANIPIHFTPGNHDVGDHPDEQTLGNYTNEWGELFGPSTAADGVRTKMTCDRGGPCFLKMNSQVFQSLESSKTQEGKKRLSDQMTWLENRMNDVVGMASKPKMIVIFTHIPPFMDAPDETSGWANWNMGIKWPEGEQTNIRQAVFKELTKPGLPLLFICGHFHADVVNDFEYEVAANKKVQVSIRVTSSAGTTMHWMGKLGFGASKASPRDTLAEAKRVAGMEVGGPTGAFVEHIIKAGGTDANLQPQVDQSGMRIFKIEGDCFYERWLLVQDLKNPANKEGGKLAVTNLLQGYPKICFDQTFVKSENRVAASFVEEKGQEKKEGVKVAASLVEEKGQAKKAFAVDAAGNVAEAGENGHEHKEVHRHHKKKRKGKCSGRWCPKEPSAKILALSRTPKHEE